MRFYDSLKYFGFAACRSFIIFTIRFDQRKVFRRIGDKLRGILPTVRVKILEKSRVVIYSAVYQLYSYAANDNNDNVILVT